MNLGIYAGSFNPVHNAHLRIAKKVIDEGIVDRVIFVPVGDNYEKSSLVNGYKRYDMIKLVIDDNKDFFVSDVEIVNGKLYSYETLDYFKNKYINDNIYLIMGSDNLSEFHLWEKYKYILDNYRLVVLSRNGQNKNNFKEYINYSNIHFIECDLELSSTEVRNNIKNNQIDEVCYKLDKKVIDYIKENRLYE